MEDGEKRTMAGEYSREMSVKITQSLRRNAARGYWSGSRIGYGLRRAVVGPTGEFRGVLAEHQRKALQSDRITLVPGPEDEQEVVRRVFHMYAYEHCSLATIRDWLKSEGVRRPYGGEWDADAVARLLENEAYVGNLVTGK